MCKIIIEEEWSHKVSFCSYMIFYSELKKYFNLSKKEPGDKDKIILAFVFLGLYFESLVTKTIHDFLSICSKELLDDFIRIEEKENFTLKNRINWFLDKIEYDEEKNKNFKKKFKQKYFRDIGTIRNMIVHGYEISHGSSLPSELHNKLNFKSLEKAMDTSNELINDFFEIIKKFDVNKIKSKLVQPNEDFLLDITDRAIDSLEKK